MTCKRSNFCVFCGYKQCSTSVVSMQDLTFLEWYSMKLLRTYENAMFFGLWFGTAEVIILPSKTGQG